MQTVASTTVQPSPPSKDTQSSQAGWDYWSRVYSDELPMPAAARDVRITDMLASETLIRAKLLFLNVPQLPTAHKNIILNLIKRELRDEISIQDVIVMPGKWYLNFYRPEDALRVMKCFNGFQFRSHILAVRFCYPDGTYSDESALTELVQCSNNVKERLLEQKEIIQNTLSPESWTESQFESLRKFENEMIKLLEPHPYLPYHNVVSSMKTLFTTKSATASYFVGDALTVWPTGFMRMFNRTCKVLSNTICLSTSAYYTQKIHDSALEGGCSVHRNSWEPAIPADIRSEHQLKQYCIAFLGQFGPQHVEIDGPLRILAQSLHGTWPKSPGKLAHLLTEISKCFAFVNQVLYLAANERHQELVVDNIAAYQDDCTDTYYLPLACTSDEQKVKIADFETL